MAAMAIIGFSTSIQPLFASMMLPRIQRRCPPSKGIYGRFERPLEEVYNMRVERGVSKEWLEELGIDRWSMWKTGRCCLPWDWHVDQQVYIVSGKVRIIPEGAKSGDRFMSFVAGDLVYYPEWFKANLGSGYLGFRLTKI